MFAPKKNSDRSKQWLQLDDEVMSTLEVKSDVELSSFPCAVLSSFVVLNDPFPEGIVSRPIEANSFLLFKMMIVAVVVFRL